MATVDPKKKKPTLLSPLNDKLGLGEGTSTLMPSAPSLRGRIQAPLGMGIPMAASIAVEQKKKEEEAGGVGAGSLNGAAKKNKKKDNMTPGVTGEAGSYHGSAYIK